MTNYPIKYDSYHLREITFTKWCGMNEQTDGWTNLKMICPIQSHSGHKNLHNCKFGSINMHTQKKRIFPLFRNALLSFVKFYMHRYFFVLKNTLLCESKTWFIGVVAKIIKLDNKFQPTKTLIFSIFGASCFGKW